MTMSKSSDPMLALTPNQDNANRNSGAQILSALAKSLRKQGETKLANEARAAACRLRSSARVRSHMARLSATGENLAWKQLTIQDVLDGQRTTG